MGGKPTGAGRTVVLASFLLGGPSGSGVATTVTLGTVAYPMLVKAGYGRDAAGGLLAAGGLGAILSPPVLGAAAFLIAQFLNISYLDVILMATIPTLLYYFALFLMVEIDARKFGMPSVVIEKHATVGALTRQYWFHFLSLIAIIVFMVIGFSPTTAVFWATVAAVAFSFLHVDCALDPVRRAARQRAARPRAVELRAHQGARGGLGRRAERRRDLRCRRTDRRRGHADRAGTQVQLDRAAVRRWRQSRDLRRAGRLGRDGRPCAAPRHQAAADRDLHLADRVDRRPRGAGDRQLHHLRRDRGARVDRSSALPNFAAHMFIFYYAVLSEVSPPTALSPFAAAAITGGDPYKTTLQSWKYTLPAFLVPFMFVLDPAGLGLAADGLVQEARGGAVGRYRRRLHYGDGRDCRARGRHAELAVQEDALRGALAADRGRARARVSESDVRLHRRRAARDRDRVSDAEKNGCAADAAVERHDRRRRCAERQRVSPNVGQEARRTAMTQFSLVTDDALLSRSVSTPHHRWRRCKCQATGLREKTERSR